MTNVSILTNPKLTVPSQRDRDIFSQAREFEAMMYQDVVTAHSDYPQFEFCSHAPTPNQVGDVSIASPTGRQP